MAVFRSEEGTWTIETIPVCNLVSRPGSYFQDGGCKEHSAFILSLCIDRGYLAQAGFLLMILLPQDWDMFGITGMPHLAQVGVHFTGNQSVVIGIFLDELLQGFYILS